ncbi:MAG TPA: thiamine pyrophosphate-dependent enzyme [Acidimicrobiales bacterium]|nr:thiamine pyrophosphate-dependent enzyme [Acidimicrobiales bacterium]
MSKVEQTGTEVAAHDPESLRLVMPGPAFRPGDQSDFSGFPTFTPGVFRRPEVHESAESMTELATGLIRVLDDEGHALGPWDPHLGAEALREGLRAMMLTRELDRRMMIDQRQSKTSFYMQCTGEEAIACAFQSALRKGDMNFPTYRQQGLLVAAGYPLELMMSQVYSNSMDPLRGRQMPVFYSAREYGFFSISGNLATQFVQGVGWAMASAIKGGSDIAASWIGDGASAETDFFSALVMASTYRAPVILNIVNNQWAISTSESVARGQAPSFAIRGRGFGIASLRVDGNDYLAVHAVASWAAERARANLGPTLVEWVTYRAAAHSSSDNPSSYRPNDEPSAWPLGDPIERLKKHLMVIGELDEGGAAAMHERVENEVRAAQSKAESFGTLKQGPKPSPREIFEDVFKTMPESLASQEREAGY